MGWKTKTFLGILIAIPTSIAISNAYFSHKYREESYAEFVGYPQRAPDCPNSDLCLTAKNGWQINIPKNDPQIVIDKKSMEKYWNRPSFSTSILIKPGDDKNFVYFRNFHDADIETKIHAETGLKISEDSENKANRNIEQIFETTASEKNRKYINKSQHYYVFTHDCTQKNCRFKFLIDDLDNSTSARIYGSDRLTGLRLLGYLNQRGVENYKKLLTEVSNDITKWSVKSPPSTNLSPE